MNNNAVRGSGGAIYYDSTGTLEITNSKFNANIAGQSFNTRYNGGAIDFKKGTLIIDGSEFTDNKITSGYGGAISIDNSRSTANEIKNSKFSQNQAEREGNAIYITSASGSGGLTIKNSEISSNQPTIAEQGSIGGPISTYNGYLTIENCGIRDNIARGRGGAIYSESKLTITKSIISGHVVANDYGGAIFQNSNDDLKITDSVIENNRAGNDGGAIYINKNGNTNIINSTFYRNTVSNGNKILSGGAIYNDGSGRLTLTNSTFNSNAVSPTEHSSFKELFSDFKGGAVFSGNDIAIDGCTFENNYVKDNGGAVYTSAGIIWGENPSKFIDNRVDIFKEHNSIASKGGAIYAGTFKNNPKGLIFIKNQAGYGGAVYINNKNEVTFESCYFEGNEASIPGGTGCGGAIYIDSSGSKLKLINNIFVDNKGKNDKGVYNCGEYTVTNNWYGINDVNFNDGYLVEWHKLKSDSKFIDSNSLRINLTSDNSEIKTYSPETLTLKFVCSDKTDFNGKLTNWNVTFRSDKKGTFTSQQVGDNKATVVYTPQETGDHTISATVNHQTVTLTFNVENPGDFEILQGLVNNAKDTLTLDRDYTYTLGTDTITEGIIINKTLKINGKGHKIDALGQSRIFNIQAPDVEINEIKFTNGQPEGSGGAMIVNGANTKILNSEFTNNDVENDYGGGAISIYRDNTLIKNSKFTNNGASYGGAINNWGKNTTIITTYFLNNKAKSTALTYEDKDEELTFTLIGGENYINAINSDNEITFSNVTYWNGAVTTDSNPIMYKAASGQNLGVLIYDSEGSPARVVILKTDEKGQATFDYSNLNPDNYTFNAYHQDNEYYTFIQTKGKFSVNSSYAYSSSVKINIPDKTEFVYGNCNISFDVVNKTEVGVAITNADHTEIYYSNLTDLNYVLVDLPASDDYYSIIVENLGNETYGPSSDTKLFKITKANSTVSINPIDDVEYSDPLTVKFSGDGDSYNVTVYDKENKAVFSQITDKQIITIPTLNVGTYTVNVTNLENENKSSSKASEKFNVVKKDNEIIVTVQNATYGEGTTLTVYANADGKYTVYINSTEIPVDVNGGIGVEALDPAAGSYKTNVTFDNPNYNNIIETQDFTIEKAQSNVIVSLGNVTYKQNTTVAIFDNFPTEYNVTIYDSGNNLKFQDIINTTSFIMPGLDVGQYNLTVINIGNKNITASQWTDIFDVTNDNYVYITAEDAIYDRDFIIYIVADVDGYYTVDINGTELTIEVTDGFGFNDTIRLPAGEYYANVTFDDDDYINIIENTTFTIYPAESHLEIYDIENVTYGEDVNIEYYDDYNATFDVVIFDENEDAVWKFRTNATSVIISDLAAGNYTLMVTNRGDDNIIGVSEFKNFTVYKATPEMNVTADGNEIIVELPEDATGEVSTIINGREEFYPVVEGLAIIPLYDLKPGNYSFDVKYTGDKNYTENSGKVNVELTKINPEMKVTANQKEINVELPEDATGNVSTTVNGKEISVPLSNGKATIPLGDLNPGNHTFDVKYTGNDKYYPRTEKTSVNIPKINPEMKVHKNNDMIIVELPEDATGNVTIEVDGEKIVEPVEDGRADFILDLDSGDYNATITYSGDDKYNPVTKNETINIDGIEMIADDVIKYFSGPEKLIVKLMNNDKPITSEKIEITLNGVTYTKVTDEKGEVSLALNLDTGNYIALVESEEYELSTLVNIEVKSTIYANDLVKVFRNATQFRALFLDGNGKAIANTNMEFNIHGVFYTRTTDANGWAELNINLEEGEYIITSINKVTGESKGNNITVISLIESSDLTKYYKNASQFVVRARSDDGGWAKEGEEVLFNINGIFYVRITNETGHASLNINLEPGDYIVTSKFRDCEQGNNITVLPVLTAENLNMKYKDGSQFTAKLVDGQGKAYPNQNIEFNVNGVLYTRTTDANGEAKLNINLMSGEYIITSSYNGASISNKITISS